MASFGSKDKANFDHHVPCQNNIHVHVFIAKFWAKPAKNKGERPQKLDSLAELISQQKWISPEIEGNEFDWNKELGYEVKTCQNWVPKRLEGWDPTSYLHKALRGELVRPQQRVRQNGIGFNWSRTHRKIAASKKMMINSRNCGYMWILFSDTLKKCQQSWIYSDPILRKTIKLCRWNDSDVSASADQRDKRHPGLLLNCQQPSQPSVLFKILKYIVGVLLTCAYSTKFNWSVSCIMLWLYPIYIPLNPSGWTLPCPHLNIGPCCLGHGNHLRLDGFGSSKLHGRLFTAGYQGTRFQI